MITSVNESFEMKTGEILQSTIPNLPLPEYYFQPEELLEMAVFEGPANYFL